MTIGTNKLKPQPPFVWPEPRAIEGLLTYEHEPPFGELAVGSHSLFGIVSALTARGIEVVDSWLQRNSRLRASLIVMVYPACATREADLARLLDLVGRRSDRLSVHLRPLERTDRATNALCFFTPESDAVHVVTGPTEDLGLEATHDGHVNFVFRADPALIDGFKRYFDWLWASSPAISATGVTKIPHLVLPEGTKEGANLWRAYVDGCDPELAADAPRGSAYVDPATGDVTILAQDGREVTSPTGALGLAKLDPLAEQVVRIYSKGAMVSIDKLSRIPPLDAPISPSLFGDVSELQRGNVIRQVRMRASIIDAKTIKSIDKRRHALRELLTKFSFGLADNMRWMPEAARELFESELKCSNEEGQKLIADLLQGDVDAFIKSRRATLVNDLNAMYVALGKSGEVTDDVIARVGDSLKDRLRKAQSADFMPKLSYSVVGFLRTNNSLVSPWGQAFSLLADIAAFPRRVLTDSFFLRGVKVREDDLIEAMNVADDALCRDLRVRGIKDRCKAELDLLARIKKAPMEARDRCDFVWGILSGEPTIGIDEALRKKEVA